MDGDHPRDGRDQIAAPMVEATALPGATPIWTQPQQAAAPVAPPHLPGRRISLIAWGLAALTGASIWALIFKLV